MKPRKTILITGASSGFGKDSVIALAKKGYQVYATMRNLKKQEKLAEALAENKLSAEIRYLDVTVPESIEKVVAEIEEKHKRLDVLINNAGYFSGGFFMDTSNEQFETQLQTNFYGCLNCTRAVLPGMQKQKSGLVVNISSILGTMGYPVYSSYVASKFALEGWSESVRYELKDDNIYVTLIEPGYFQTEIGELGKIQKSPGTHDQESPYHHLYDGLSKESSGADPAVVIKKIVKVVETPKPKVRYVVGQDAFWGMIARKFLPISRFEKMMESSLRK